MTFREFILFPLSQIYRLGNFLHRKVVSGRSRRFALPVISVGGIGVGGSGKTPMVRKLIEIFQDEYHLIILSRGYGRSSSQEIIWQAGAEPIPSAGVIGDEPVLLARTLRKGLIGVGSNRSNILDAIIREHKLPPNTLVLLDDGFQHYRLQRDLDIVLLDERSAAERSLLPGGYLREPFQVLQRADLLVTSGEKGEAKSREFREEGASVARITYRADDIVHWQRGSRLVECGQRVMLVTGIARPERVVASLATHSVRVVRQYSFRDHYHYSVTDAKRILHEAQRMGVDAIITTEKDAVKLETFRELENLLYVLPLNLEIQDQDEFITFIKNTIHRKFGKI